MFIVCQTEAEVQRLSEIFGSTQVARDGRLHFPLGRAAARLPAGARDGIVLVSSGELFHRADLQRPARRRLGRVIDSFLELREGDLVVHVAHGIARYRGLKLLEKDGQVEEHLVLEFRGGTKLYVPARRSAWCRSTWAGRRAGRRWPGSAARSGTHRRTRSRRPSATWPPRCSSCRPSRASRPGITFPADTDWQQEFDASFPYQETPDQLTTIEAIKHDMQQPRPMDRLLCGDVGYGKTEVAMRAAFKAVDAGYQVAVLVPTTVLAEQHLRTFTERLAEFPFEIAVLSRFCTTAAAGGIIEAAGRRRRSTSSSARTAWRSPTCSSTTWAW